MNQSSDSQEGGDTLKVSHLLFNNVRLWIWMVSIVDILIRGVLIDYWYLKEILDTLDWYIMFGILDLNMQILKVVQTLLDKISNYHSEEEAQYLTNICEQLTLKILAQSQPFILDEVTIPSPTTLKT